MKSNKTAWRIVVLLVILTLICMLHQNNYICITQMPLLHIAQSSHTTQINNVTVLSTEGTRQATYYYAMRARYSDKSTVINGV